MSNLGELLDAAGKPDWQVGAAAGLHPTLISLYRTGARKMPERHAGLLADYFGVPIDVIRDELPIPWDVVRESVAE